MSLLPIGIDTTLANATTPKQTKVVESVSSAAMAYAKEQDDYELFMNAWRVYIDARRKTTQLILDGNMDVTEQGFTKMQWLRRRRELEVPQDKLDAYFDELISFGWQPSIAGMLRHSSGEEKENRTLEDRLFDYLVEMRKNGVTKPDALAIVERVYNR